MTAVLDIDAVVGCRRRLAAVEHAGQHIDVPADMSATLEFSADGRFLADDTVNALSGRFVATPTGFRTSNVVTTLVGYVGGDPVRMTVIAAVDAICFVVQASASPLAAEVSSRAQVSGDILTVQVAHYQLTFERLLRR